MVIVFVTIDRMCSDDLCVLNADITCVKTSVTSFYIVYMYRYVLDI